METALQHVNSTIAELDYYWDVVQNAKDILQSAVARRHLRPVLLKPGHGVPDCDVDITAHYSFHFAQQLHYPSHPHHPGPLYFKTPRRCGLFAVMAEAIPQMALFLLDEATETGKGADTIISILDFFFQNLGLKETKVHLHAYNCPGQSQSHTLIQYLLWRVMTKRHAEVKLSLLVNGQTKLSLDWFIGLFKHKFRRSRVDCLKDIVRVALQASSQRVFVPQLCATEDGRCLVPLRDWTGYLNTWFRKVGDLKKYHHFTFRRSGTVYLQRTCKSGPERINLLKGSEVPPRGQTAPVIRPPGLSRQRAEYLYREIRQFVAPQYRDLVCPRPSAAPSSVRSSTVRAGRAASAASTTPSSNASAAASITTSTAAAAPSVSRKAGGLEKKPQGFTAGKASQKPASQTFSTQRPSKKVTEDILPPGLAGQRAAVPNTQMNQTGKQAATTRPQTTRTTAIKTAATPKGRQLTTDAKGKKPVTVECTRGILRENREKVSHTCNRQCVKDSEEDLNKFIGKNPLRLPILCGWKRKAYSRQAGYGRQVIYRTPCGRYLQSLEAVDEFLSVTDSQLYIDHFCFDISLDVNKTFVPYKILFELADISEGQERVPISCVNCIDEEEGPKGVKYCSFRLPAEGVNIPLDEGFLQCCDCVDNCRDKSKCSCQQLTIENTTWIGNRDPTAGYHHRRLKEHNFTGVVECNTRCPCDRRCRNRLVQNGLSCRLQVFKTRRCGWGVRCLDSLPEGGFICTFTGQVLTDPMANALGKQRSDQYLADLDFLVKVEEAKELLAAQGSEAEDGTSEDSGQEEADHSEGPVLDTAGPSDRRVSEPMDTDSLPDLDGPDLLSSEEDRQSAPAATQTTEREEEDEEEEEEEERGGGRGSLLQYTSSSIYTLDAQHTGNVGRYLNHSCSPNLFVQNVFVDTHDLRFPWVAFFAKQNIPAGAELTWDYKYMIGSVCGKTLPCFCGARNCSSRLL